MPRGRKKKTAPETVAETSTESVTTATAAAAEEPHSPPVMKEQPPFEPTGTYTPTTEDLADADWARRGQFRTWDVDTERSYTRMTDEKHQRIILQFAEKPPADVLTALKGAGFHYQPDYQGQKSAWVRRNDHEGRLQVEAIEKLIQELIPGRAASER